MMVYMPAVLGLAGSILFLWLMNWVLLARHETLGAQSRLPRQLVMLALTVATLLMLIILFPMTDSTRGQVITLLSVVITGVIALSSTSFVANVMAGLMLQVVKSFNPGDFIRVGERMGRVTERGLFHIEIQTEDRDLTTIPNLHLATNPVTVVHSTGTIISAELSLGYDISHTKIEELLKQAANQAGLQDAFVLIISLNDYSITYRASGFLSEVKNLITARSNLKKRVLDVLHENDIEIVSPSFMNQRVLAPNRKTIPHEDQLSVHLSMANNVTPEEIIFDKADVAAESENLRVEIEKLNEKIIELTQSKKGLSKDEKKNVDSDIEIIERKMKKISSDLKDKVDNESM